MSSVAFVMARTHVRNFTPCMIGFVSIEGPFLYRAKPECNMLQVLLDYYLHIERTNQNVNERSYRFSCIVDRNCHELLSWTIYWSLSFGDSNSVSWHKNPLPTNCRFLILMHRVFRTQINSCGSGVGHITQNIWYPVQQRCSKFAPKVC